MTDASSGPDTATVATVTVESETPEPVAVPDSPTVVTVDTGSDDSPSVDVALLVGALTARVDTLESRIDSIETTAEVAEETADLALDVAVSEPEPIPEPVEEPEPVPDEEPEPVHWLHKRHPFKSDD